MEDRMSILFKSELDNLFGKPSLGNGKASQGWFVPHSVKVQVIYNKNGNLERIFFALKRTYVVKLNNYSN